MLSQFTIRPHGITLGAALSEGYTMHTSTSELLRNYPSEPSLPSLDYAGEDLRPSSQGSYLHYG